MQILEPQSPMNHSPRLQNASSKSINTMSLSGNLLFGTYDTAFGLDSLFRLDFHLLHVSIELRSRLLGLGWLVLRNLGHLFFRGRTLWLDLALVALSLGSSCHLLGRRLLLDFLVSLASRALCRTHHTSQESPIRTTVTRKTSPWLWLRSCSRLRWQRGTEWL